MKNNKKLDLKEKLKINLEMLATIIAQHPDDADLKAVVEATFEEIINLVAQKEKEVREEIEKLADRKFPRGERLWCIECAKRIKKELLARLEETKMTNNKKRGGEK